MVSYGEDLRRCFLTGDDQGVVKKGLTQRNMYHEHENVETQYSRPMKRLALSRDGCRPFG